MYIVWITVSATMPQHATDLYRRIVIGGSESTCMGYTEASAHSVPSPGPAAFSLSLLAHTRFSSLLHWSVTHTV